MQNNIYTPVELKQNIINQLNFVSNNRLKEIDLFIRFLLYEKQENTHLSKTTKEDNAESDFFDICGIWQDKTIDANSLRKKAWREQTW